jgi:hypothetical protein
MEDLSLAVPGLWADHHVLAVLDLLRGEQGVADVAASALHGTLRLRYDPELTDAGRITARLEDAGYGVGEAPPQSAPQDVKASDGVTGWATGLRVVTTDPADLSMSGDHRKY